MVIELNEDTFDAFIENNKCVLIDCWAPWCGPCRRMAPVVEKLEEELKGKVAVAKLNTDDNPGISARFEITAIPTLLIFKDKVMIEPLVGLRPMQDIVKYLSAKGIIDGSAAPKATAENHFAAVVTDGNFNEFVSSKDHALVDCWAPWCKPCLRMGPVIEKLAEISKDDIAVGKLNVDENPGTSLNFNIQSIPALLVFRKGKHVGTIVGYSQERTAETLRAAVLDL